MQCIVPGVDYTPRARCLGELSKFISRRRNGREEEGGGSKERREEVVIRVLSRKFGLGGKV